MSKRKIKGGKLAFIKQTSQIITPQMTPTKDHVEYEMKTTPSKREVNKKSQSYKEYYQKLENFDKLLNFRLDRFTLKNTNDSIPYTKIITNSSTEIKYSYIKNNSDIKLNEKQLKAIIQLDDILIKEFNTIKETLKGELNKTLEKIEDIEKIEDETYKYLNKLENEKITLINEIIKNNMDFIDENELEIDSIVINKQKEEQAKKSSLKGGNVSIKYKNLNSDDGNERDYGNEATDVIKKMCEERGTNDVFDFIKRNRNQRIRHKSDDPNSENLFSEDDKTYEQTVEYTIENINPISGIDEQESKYSRKFRYRDYNKELLYYTENKLVNNNDLIKRFVEKQTEYLKTLELFDRLTVNDYTKEFYKILNYWKLQDPAFTAIKTSLSTGHINLELADFLNPQIFKVLTRKHIRLDINQNAINNYENILLVDNTQLVGTHLDEIFKQYEIDLNRIISEAPPRIYSFNVLRGSGTDYVFDNNANVYYLSNRFSSFTIDIFEQIALNFANEAFIYDTLLTPTAKVLFVSPLSFYNYELEILQASNQVICKSYDNRLTKIYVYKYNDNFQEDNLLCDNIENRKKINVRLVVIA